MSNGCDPGTLYLLMSVSPQALLAYVAEGLLAPILIFLYRKNSRGRRRIIALLDTVKAWSGD